MLGMIEINLLPQEYRVQERTPLGLFLTIVVGICTVGAVGVYEMKLQGDLAEKTKQKTDLTNQKTEWDAKKAATVELEKKIETAKKRQETIIQISQSKMIWSQKLAQFGKLMDGYKDFWIDRLELQKGGKLRMNFYAMFSEKEGFNRVAEFESSLLNETNFWYHFEKFDAPTKRVTSGPGGPLARYNYTGPVVQFDVTIPVRELK